MSEGFLAPGLEADANAPDQERDQALQQEADARNRDQREERLIQPER